MDQSLNEKRLRVEQDNVGRPGGRFGTKLAVTLDVETPGSTQNETENMVVSELGEFLLQNEEEVQQISSDRVTEIVID